MATIAKKLLSDLECSDSELSIVLIDDAEMQELNSSYRGKNKPTDVLSFPQEELAGQVSLLGDVVISLETASRQAGELGHSLWYETVRLLVHGVLHLCGYEHEDVSNSVAEEMFAKEAELISGLSDADLL